LPEEAELFWKLVPESKAENIVPFGTNATT
jgi:hypothetical protein